MTAALVTLVHCKANDASDDKICDTAQALVANPMRGHSMPAKTIALTFDDGPGDRTMELSKFLKEEGIEAAFFVNGRMINDNLHVLQQVMEDGHLIANHTETHASLTGAATATAPLTDAETVKELADTDAKIAPFVTGERFLFRPPFGDWNETAFAALEASDMKKYVGPIFWDVGDRLDEAAGRAADWDCWQDGTDAKRLTTQQCGDLYLTEIRRNGRGIVLMHDPYYNDLDPNLEGTVDMVKYMVPILKAEGFAFLRVDKVPDIAKALPALEDRPDAGTDPNNAEPIGGEGPNAAPPGDGNDPCPPAPQPTTSEHSGESGNLRKR